MTLKSLHLKSHISLKVCYNCTESTQIVGSVFFIYICQNISKGKGMKNCGTIIVGKSTNPKMKTLLDFISRTTKIKIQQSEIPIPEAKTNKPNDKKDN